MAEPITIATTAAISIWEVIQSLALWIGIGFAKRRLWDDPQQEKKFSLLGAELEAFNKLKKGLDGIPHGLEGEKLRKWLVENFTSVAEDIFVEERVLRGGSWFNDALFLRVALRSRNLPNLPYGFVGFRCVRGTVTP